MTLQPEKNGKNRDILEKKTDNQVKKSADKEFSSSHIVSCGEYLPFFAAIQHLGV